MAGVFASTRCTVCPVYSPPRRRSSHRIIEYADGAASDYLPTTHFGSGDVLLKQTVETLARIQQSERLRREL